MAAPHGPRAWSGLARRSPGSAPDIREGFRAAQSEGPRGTSPAAVARNGRQAPRGRSRLRRGGPQRYPSACKAGRGRWHVLSLRLAPPRTATASDALASVAREGQAGARHAAQRASMRAGQRRRAVGVGCGERTGAPVGRAHAPGRQQLHARGRCSALDWRGAGQADRGSHRRSVWSPQSQCSRWSACGSARSINCESTPT